MKSSKVYLLAAVLILFSSTVSHAGGYDYNYSSNYKYNNSYNSDECDDYGSYNFSTSNGGYSWNTIIYRYNNSKNRFETIRPSKPIQRPSRPSVPVEKPEEPSAPVEKPETPVEKPETPTKPNPKPVPTPDPVPNEKPDPVVPEDTAGLSSQEAEVVRLVNIERQKAGLSPLKASSQLSNVARIKSQDMAQKNYFSHTSPTYGSPFDMMKQFGIKYTTAGENIAKGYSSASAVVKGWMNSSGHRDNILNPSFGTIGVGAYSQGGTIYWTQMFTN